MRGLRFEITANSLVDLLSLLIAAKVRTRAIGSLSLPALPHEKFYGQELELAELECESVAAELLVRPLAAREILGSLESREGLFACDQDRGEPTCACGVDQKVSSRISPHDIAR